MALTLGSIRIHDRKTPEARLSRRRHYITAPLIGRRTCEPAARHRLSGCYYRATLMSQSLLNGIAGATMKRTVAVFFVLSLFGGCGKEPPPRTVSEFMEDPILLEATMVRCGQDRAATRYEPECVNARDAVDRIAAAREQQRRRELEAESERKRQALRRAQEAAADARRRAQEAQERREEAANYGEFEPLPPKDETPPDGQPAVDEGESGESAGADNSAPTQPQENPQPVPQDGGVARIPVITESEPDLGRPADTDPQPATELDAVREELKRRQDAEQE